MDFSATISRRDDFAKQLPLPGLTLRPTRWSASDAGGYKEAVIEVAGSRDALQRVLTLLRSWVRIYNPDGAQVWGGLVWTVTLHFGPTQYEISLDEVWNRIRVRYTALDADGYMGSHETDWSDDSQSQAAYGVRELRISLEEAADSALAAQRLAAELQRLRYPTAARGEGDGSYSATLRCVGGMEELAGLYYAHTAGRVEYQGGSGVDHPIGWQVSDTGFAFGRNRKVFSSFKDKLPPLPVGSQFSVAGSLSNDGTYTVERAPSSGTSTYTSSGLWFTTTDDIHDTSAGLGGIDLGQHLKVSGPGLTNDGQYIVDGTGTDHITVEGSGITDEGSTGSPVTGTLTAAQYLITQQGIAADEMQNDATTYIVKVIGERVAQRFQVSSGFGALWKVAVMVATVGTPTDSLRVSVYGDNSGIPGSLIDTGLLAASGVGVESEAHWVEMDNAGTNTLSAGTDYYVVVQRTGSFDADNYWVIQIEDNAADLYSEQALFYDGSTWAVRPTAASMPFWVWAGVDVATQIKTVIDDVRDSSVIEGVHVAETAGVLVNPYEDGDRRALDVVRSLLAVGGDDGYGLVLESLQERRLVVRRQPQEWAYQRVARGADGDLHTVSGGPVTPGQLFYGEWMEDVAAPQSSPLLAPFSPVYVREMAYSVERGVEIPADGAASVFDFGYRNG